MWTDFLFDEFQSFYQRLKLLQTAHTKAEISLKMDFDIVTNDFLPPFYIFYLFAQLESYYSPKEKTSEIEI